MRVARLLRPIRAAPDPDRERLRLDDDSLDEVANNLGSFRW